MIAHYDHIQQLQAELRNCIDRRERAAIRTELAKAIAEQAMQDREFDRVIDEFIEKGG